MRIYTVPKYGWFFDESKRTTMPDEIYIASLSEDGSFFNESKRTAMPDEIYISSIWISDEILNESLGRVQVGKGNKNIFDVNIYGNEGYLPHFHMKSIEEGRNSAILLFDNMYFTHKNARYVFKNDKIIYRIIDEFLKSINKDSGSTQWFTMVTKFLAINHKPTNLTDRECYSMPYPDYRSGIKSTDFDQYNYDLEQILGRKITKEKTY